MKATLFQLVSSSAVLSLMAGAVGYHWYQLEQWDTGDEFGSGDQYALVSEWAGEAVAVSSRGEVESDSTGTPRADQEPEMEATVTALREIVSVLRDLKEENSDLREQIKESNRDLTEMRFNIEMNSRSFRPLKIDSGSAGPFQQQHQESQHPLLPPKRR